tara:strand:- start:252 stop:653 length:402 start_codon:yes stop_codon:yes gene_type:complete
MKAKLAQAIAGPLVQLVDELFTTKEERAAAKLKLLEMDLQPVMAQIEVNKAEASNPSLFVAGWRPFIGWTCGAILVWNYIVVVLLQWLLMLADQDIPPLPTLGVNEMMPVLMGLLGLGGMRTFEKFKGVEGNR